MNELKVTLIGDGSSDKALQWVVKWLLDDAYPKLASRVVFADFRRLPDPPKKSDVAEQLAAAKLYYPFDILVYHRDAETTDLSIIEKRKNEVFREVSRDDKNVVVCLVPIKMMETWLLICKEAIKKAAGNRNYREAINLPKLKKLEKENQPKELLHRLLKDVSNLRGRKLAKFNVHQSVHLVAENIRDYSELRELKAFQVFEKDLREIVNTCLENSN